MALKSFSFTIIPFVNGANAGIPMLQWHWRTTEEADTDPLHHSRAVGLSDALAAYLCARLLSHLPVYINFPMAQEQAWPGYGTAGTDINTLYTAAEYHSPVNTLVRIRRLPFTTSGTYNVADAAVMITHPESNPPGQEVCTMADIGYVDSEADRHAWQVLESWLATASEYSASMARNLRSYMPKDVALNLSNALTSSPIWGWKFNLKALLSNGETQNQDVKPMPLLIRLLDGFTRPFTPWVGTALEIQSTKLAAIQGDVPANYTLGPATSYSLQVDTLITGDEALSKPSNAYQSLFFRPGSGASDPTEWDLVPYYTLRAGRDTELYPDGWQGLHERSPFAEWWATVKPQHSDVWTTFIMALYFDDKRQLHRTYKVGSSDAEDLSQVLTLLHDIDTAVGTVGTTVNTLANTSIPELGTALRLIGEQIEGVSSGVSSAEHASNLAAVLAQLLQQQHRLTAAMVLSLIRKYSSREYFTDLVNNLEDITAGFLTEEEIDKLLRLAQTSEPAAVSMNQAQINPGALYEKLFHNKGLKAVKKE